MINQTRFEVLTAKKENKVFACRADSVDRYEEQINNLFKEGWLLEKTEFVGSTYVLFLEKKYKVFYTNLDTLDDKALKSLKDSIESYVGDKDFVVLDGQ